MIPEFYEHGYLPPGIHEATIDEIELRFGRESELRQTEMQSLHWLMDIVVRAGIERLVINGSFVTEAYEPNDVDCALLPASDFDTYGAAATELADGLPFLQIELLKPQDFAVMVTEIYASDRYGMPKGVVEIIGWK